MKRATILWLALLAGPVLWFASMNANFALAPWACSLHWKPALFSVSVIAMVLTAASGWVSWREWQQIGREFPGESSGEVATSRVLASGGVLLNAMFFLVILAQGIAETLLGACQ
jgi:hypothetical protein